MPRAKPKRKQPDRRRPLPKRLTLTREHMLRIEDLPGFARDHVRSADALVARIESITATLAQETDRDEVWGNANAFTPRKIGSNQHDER